MGVWEGGPHPPPARPPIQAASTGGGRPPHRWRPRTRFGVGRIPAGPPPIIFTSKLGLKSLAPAPEIRREKTSVLFHLRGVRCWGKNHRIRLTSDEKCNTLNVTRIQTLAHESALNSAFGTIDAKYSIFVDK